MEKSFYDEIQKNFETPIPTKRVIPWTARVSWQSKMTFLGSKAELPMKSSNIGYMHTAAFCVSQYDFVS